MSNRWTSLRAAILTLRTQFLPAPFDPVGNYPDMPRVYAHTRAFLVLSHAECESFIEGWAKEIAQTSEAVYNRSKRMTAPLSFLLNCVGNPLGIPESITAVGGRDAAQRLDDAVVRLFQQYYKRIKDNNGLKEKNVLSLFSPLGIGTAALPSALLGNLDAFGSLRGDHAHNSGSVVSVPDPETEFRRVEQLLAELQTLDRWLGQYKRRIR